MPNADWLTAGRAHAGSERAANAALAVMAADFRKYRRDVSFMANPLQVTGNVFLSSPPNSPLVTERLAGGETIDGDGAVMLSRLQLSGREIRMIR